MPDAFVIAQLNSNGIDQTTEGLSPKAIPIRSSILKVFTELLRTVHHILNNSASETSNAVAISWKVNNVGLVFPFSMRSRL
jgi:hypothetical protein